MNLTESQRRAVEHGGGNLQLIACAGSGKTEVVARRVVHLLTPGRPRAQLCESGDIVALSFADPNAEARHIAATIQRLRGVALRQDAVERGLSWSDMAILLRSVKANAERIARALQAAGIPFVVAGVTNLFGTAGAEAGRRLLYFVAEVKAKVRDDAEALRTATLPTVPPAKKCGACHYRGMCTAGRAAAGTQ